MRHNKPDRYQQRRESTRSERAQAKCPACGGTGIHKQCHGYGCMDCGYSGDCQSCKKGG